MLPFSMVNKDYHIELCRQPNKMWLLEQDVTCDLFALLALTL